MEEDNTLFLEKYTAVAAPGCSGPHKDDKYSLSAESLLSHLLQAGQVLGLTTNISEDSC